MSTPKFADTHNLVAFLEKPEESNGFEEIIDFLNASSVQYALTVNPTIYTSCIEQFWATAKVKTVNEERQLQALVDKKKVIITAFHCDAIMGQINAPDIFLLRHIFGGVTINQTLATPGLIANCQCCCFHVAEEKVYVDVKCWS
ncbi:hypothetical protein Tco_1145072 [Tanacetum coccineum]